MLQDFVFFQTKNNRPMRTSQLYMADGHKSNTKLHNLRFDGIKAISSKRSPTVRLSLANPAVKNPKHAAVLQENGINFDQPLNPQQVAVIRAERIAKEKKQGNQVSATATSTAVSIPQQS